MSLSTLDLIIVAAYGLLLFGIAQWVSREPAGGQKNTEDYFLAGKSLPWWAIGASLVAANISAEQIIGMSGDGYKIGLAIAAYEWQAAIVLIIVAKYFLPIFLKREIYTMPQFLETRYGEGVKTTMSIFWLVLYTVVNLTAVMWLGSLAVNTLTGVSLFWGMAVSLFNVWRPQSGCANGHPTSGYLGIRRHYYRLADHGDDWRRRRCIGGL